ncbi:MAG: hypothetical protein OEY34_05410, partial [Cyclobacteriaceae bacterium]|nr:hypothetical protein [Cyclobacteriaceae bacterium]
MRINAIIGWLFIVLIVSSCSVEKSAQRAFRLGEYQIVIQKYEGILKKNPRDPQANYYIAESYRLSNRPGLAEPYYKKAIDGGIKNDSIGLNYAYSLKSGGKYKEAKAVVDQYLASTKDEFWIKRANEQAEGLSQIDYLRSIKNYYRVKNLEELNTPDIEYSPIYSDGQLYFTSSRNSDKEFRATGQGFSDLYRVNTEAANVDMSTLEALSEAINLPNVNEGTITFTPDGKTMVFARGNTGKRKGDFDVDLWMSRKRNNQWTAPRKININKPTYWDSSPAFSRDGRTLYFASNRDGGEGGVDLYSASMDSRGRFRQPKNLGPVINTTGDDMFPYVADDGSLYFASDGHPGFGGLDLFVVRRVNGEVKIENMGEPMNSNADDFGIFLFKADRGFFSSNREGGKGDDDIYTFINQDPDLKIINYFLEGITMTPDEDTLQILPGVKVQLMDYNGEVLDEITTGSDGKFAFRVYEHERYSLVGEKKGIKEKYLTTRVPFSTIGRGVDRTTLTKMVTDIKYDTLLVLEKQEIDVHFVLENILYDLDRWEIREDAALELDKLVTLLKDNPE